MDTLVAQIPQLRDKMTAGFSATSSRFEALENTLRGEIRGVDERLSTQMRVLHEDVISRLQLIQEGQTRRRKRKS